MFLWVKIHPWLSLFVQAKKLLNFLPKQVPSVPINCYAQKDKMFNATGIFAKYLMRQSLGNSPVGLLQECKNRCRSRSSVTMVSLASQDVRTVIKQMTCRLRKKIFVGKGTGFIDTLNRWQVSHRTQVLSSECVLSAYQSTSANPK